MDNSGQRIFFFWALGIISGGVLAIIDALWSGSDLNQFLPHIGDKLFFVCSLMSLYALLGGIISSLGGAFVLLLVKGTALKEFIKIPQILSAQKEHADGQSESHALMPLSLVLVGLPLVAGCLLLAFYWGVEIATYRHHKGLIVLSVFLLGFGGLVFSGLATLIVGRVVELVLVKVLPLKTHQILSRGYVLLGILLFNLSVAVIGVVVVSFETLSMLSLRPFIVGLGFGPAILISWKVLKKTLNRLSQFRLRLKAIGAAGVLILLLFGSIGPDFAPGVRKGIIACSGLGSYLIAPVKMMTGLISANKFEKLVMAQKKQTKKRILKDVQFISPPGSIPKDFNILFLIVDTVRASNVSAYGYHRKTTPVIDAIADEGALFENAWAHAPSTRLSVPAILTGRHPSQVYWNKTVFWPGLSSGNNTIAEEMKRAGLKTGAILNSHYFHKKRLMNQGFGYYNNKNAKLHSGKDPAKTTGTSSKQQADLSIAFVEKNAGKRWFLWTHFYDPHYTYQLHPGTKQFGEAKIDRYDHEILFTDEQIGRLIRKLKQLGIYDKTAIVITSDHGEGFGEHGVNYHGYHLYAAQTKVPLIIRIPGIKPKRIQMPAGHVDLLPTLTNLVGGRPKADMFGRSLLDVISGMGDATQDRMVFQELLFTKNKEKRGVATRQWHLLYNFRPDNTFELYDIIKDPNETRDLWGTVPVPELQEALVNWTAATRNSPEGYQKLATSVFKGRAKAQVPLSVNWSKLKLLGVDLHTKTVKPGGVVSFTCYYKPTGKLINRVRFNYQVKKEGIVYRKQQHALDGTLPFYDWPIGQGIADKVTVKIPKTAKPGQYQIYAGLLDAKGKPLKASGKNVTQDSSAVLLGTVAIP